MGQQKRTDPPVEQIELEAMMRTPGWGYFQRLVANSIEQTRDMLEMSKPDSWGVPKLQGRVEALRQFVAIGDEQVTVAASEWAKTLRGAK